MLSIATTFTWIKWYAFILFNEYISNFTNAATCTFYGSSYIAFFSLKILALNLTRSFTKTPEHVFWTSWNPCIFHFIFRSTATFIWSNGYAFIFLQTKIAFFAHTFLDAIFAINYRRTLFSPEIITLLLTFNWADGPLFVFWTIWNIQSVCKAKWKLI